MEDSFIQRLEQNGTIVQTGSNKPFLISESDKIWFVKSGHIDIFAVGIQNGEPSGARSYLFTINENECLFGLGAHDRNQNAGLLAVGTFGTNLIEVNHSLLEKLSKDGSLSADVFHLIETWLKKFSTAISPSIAPKEYTDTPPGGELDAAMGQIIRPKEGIFWVRHLQGSSFLMGGEAVSQIPAETFFPVTEHTWLVTKEEQNKLAIVDTPSYLKHADIRSGISNFHKIAVKCLGYKANELVKSERAKLDSRIARDKQISESALLELASVIEKNSLEKIIPPAEGNNLFAACRLVGEKLGINIVKPSQDDDSQKTSDDPLMEIIRRSNIRIRTVRLRDDWWKKDNGPMLAFMAESKKPVALLPINPIKYNLADPSEGKREQITSEIAAAIDPTAYIFYRPLPDKVLSARDIFRFAIKMNGRDVLTVILMGLLGGLLGMITPLATGQIFDNVIPGAERNQLIQLTFALIVGALAAGLFQITRGFALLRVESRTDNSLQAAVWDRLLKLPAPFFRKYSVGDLAVRANSINEIRQILSGTVMSTILSSVFSIFNLFLLFYYSWKLALVATALVSIAIFVTITTSYLQVKYQRIVTSVQGKLSGLVLQLLTGISKLRVAGAEMRAYSIWAKQFAYQRRMDYKAVMIENMMAVFNSVFHLLCMMVIFAFIAFYLREKEGAAFSTGAFLAFNAAFGQFLMATLSMAKTTVSLINVIPIYERAKPILTTLPEVDVTKGSPGELSGEIEMSHVFFKYTKDGPHILRDISLKIEPGEFVAFVGPSGSGKSTVLRLLLGFESPESGSIYYGSGDLDSLDLHLVRRQLGVVLQNGRVMAGDIFGNIVGMSRLTMDDAWEAARLAGFDEDIKQMPMGMHTYLPEGGGTFSGGQRQRLMVARAMVHKPRIMLFDEATSALDNKTQAIVSESLDKMEATRIVIAHRLSTIINADRIYVIVAGEIVQSGSYNELIDQPGPFSELAKRQLT